MFGRFSFEKIRGLLPFGTVQTVYSSFKNGRLQGSLALFSNSALRQGVSLVLTLGMLLSNVLPAWALPEGYQSVAGNVQFSQPDANTLNVTTAANRSIANYQSFNIAGHETVNFILPGASSVILNRVIGGNPSTILGRMNSNGQVFLVNPSGIIFGQTAQVNVAGLVASTLNISDADFLAGNYQFTNAVGGLNAGLTNHGNLQATQYLALLSSAISNTGTLNAPNVAMAVGDKVTLDITPSLGLTIHVDEKLKTKVADVQDAIANSGQIEGQHIQMVADLTNALYDRAVNQTGIVKATGFGQTANGKIVLYGKDDQQKAIVQNQGTLEATSTTGDGGTIHLLGDYVAHSGLMDVSGVTGGGNALVGGDYQGNNLSIYNAERTWIGSTGVIKADALTSGAGGKVIVWANDATDYFGTISAKGISQGGFVETSGKNTINIQNIVDVSTTHGPSGTWLLDPNDISIVAGGANTNINATSPFATSNNTASLGVNLITAALALGNVSITTGTAGTNSQNGDITLSTPLNYTGVGGNTLTLNAHRNININSSISSTNALNLTLNADTDANTTGNITSNASGTINLGGGALNLNGRTITLGADVTTGGGNATLTSGTTISTTAMDTGAGSTYFTAPTSVAVSYATANKAIKIAQATTPSLTVTASGQGSHINLNTAFTGNTLSLNASSSTGAFNNVNVTGDITVANAPTIRSYRSDVTITGNITDNSTTGTTTIAAGTNSFSSGTNLNVSGTLNIAGGAAKTLSIWDGDNSIFSKAWFTDGGNRSFGTVDLRSGSNNGAFNLTTMTGINPASIGSLTLVTLGNSAGITLPNTFAGTTLNLQTTGTSSGITMNGGFNGGALTLLTQQITDTTSPISVTGDITSNNTVNISSYRGNVSILGTGNFTHTGANAVTLRAGYENNSTLRDSSRTLTVNGTVNIGANAAKNLTFQVGDGTSFFRTYPVK